MPSYCKIQLQNPDQVFRVGNTVEGTLKCYFEREKKIKGIKLTLKGEENTHWTEKEKYYDEEEEINKYKAVHYTGKEEYLADEVLLAREAKLAAGRHVYPFSLLLPTNLPGTFHNQYGGINYEIKATVDIPWELDFGSETKITVQSEPINFRNISPDLQRPIHWSDEKVVGSCCFQSGPVSFDLYLQREAFVPGEVITGIIECVNKSDVNVENVEVELQMIIESKAKFPRIKTKEDTKTVSKYAGPGVGGSESRTYEFDINIPPDLAVYNFEKSVLFSQYFDIKATCELSGSNTNLYIGGSLRFGHIPYGPPPDLESPINSQPVESSIGFTVNSLPEMPMPKPIVDTDGFEPIDDQNEPRTDIGGTPISVPMHQTDTGHTATPMPQTDVGHIAMPMPQTDIGHTSMPMPVSMPMPQPVGGYPPVVGYPPVGGYPPSRDYPPSGGYPPPPSGGYPPRPSEGYPPPRGYPPPPSSPPQMQSAAVGFGGLSTSSGPNMPSVAVSIGGPSTSSGPSGPTAPSAPFADEDPSPDSPMLPPSYDEAMKLQFTPYPPK